VCPFEKIVLVYHDCLTEEGIFKNNSIYNEYLRAVSIRNPNIPSITTDEFSNYTFHNHMEYYYNESHINKIRGYQMPPRDEIKQKLGILLAKLKKRK
jgi:hypothetical protein